MFENEKLLKRIVIDPGIMVGKPVIKGTRLTVDHIIGLLAQGLTREEIIYQHPNLTKKISLPVCYLQKKLLVLLLCLMSQIIFGSLLRKQFVLKVPDYADGVFVSIESIGDIY